MVALRTTVALTGLLATLLLSGCSASNSPDGQVATAAGSIAYNGASTGTDRAQPFSCDGPAEVSVTSNIGSGSVRITVKDGAGTTIYAKTLGGPGQAADSKTVSGAAGAWSLTGVREAGSYGGTWAPGAGGGFSGQYAATVSC